MSNKMITSAISAVLALSISSAGTAIAAEDSQNSQMQQMMGGDLKGMEKCYGVSKAGQNDCSTASHGCAGEAKKDGLKTEWVAVPTGLCNKIVGGSTKAPEKI